MSLFFYVCLRRAASEETEQALKETGVIDWAAHANLNKSQAYTFMRNNFSTVPWLTV